MEGIELNEEVLKLNSINRVIIIDYLGYIKLYNVMFSIASFSNPYSVF